MTEPLVVLFEDQHCLAVVKAAGLLTQGTAAGELTLEAEVRRYLTPGAPEARYLGTVHRLDRPVSGVVVWAKTPKGARRLAEQFAQGLVRKEDWAVVEDVPETVGSDPGRDPGRVETWDDWLSPPDEAGVARVVEPMQRGARRAITQVQRGAGGRLPRGLTWLVLRPKTGRTHQLRAQTAARGRPILGDHTYGAVRGFP